MTLLHYVSNFQPQNLGGPPWPNPGSAPGTTRFRLLLFILRIEKRPKIDVYCTQLCLGLNLVYVDIMSPVSYSSFGNILFCLPCHFSSILNLNPVGIIFFRFKDFRQKSVNLTVWDLSHVFQINLRVNLSTRYLVFAFSFSLTHSQPICDLGTFSLNQKLQSVCGPHQCNFITSQCERWVDFLTYGLHYQQ